MASAVRRYQYKTDRALFPQFYCFWMDAAVTVLMVPLQECQCEYFSVVVQPIICVADCKPGCVDVSVRGA